MSTARYIIGDVLDVLRTLPDDSVDLVLTSPPFLALRSYLPADSPLKAKELGSEPTPGTFIDALLDVVEECRRVLAPHGTLCIELGDTYAGSGGAGGDYDLVGGLRAGQPIFDGSEKRSRADGKGGNVYRGGRRQDPKMGTGWPLDKSLALVPESFRWALAYGRNPFTGRETEPWRIRNVIRWVRPNPPVGALGDKFRPATSEMVVACTSRTRYFDLDAVREPHSAQSRLGRGDVDGTTNRRGHGPGTAGGDARGLGFHNNGNPAGAPPLDWWAIPTEPFKGAHYATWPRDLLVKPIKAMCPERVCRVCGESSRRIMEKDAEYAAFMEHKRSDAAALAMRSSRAGGGPRQGNVENVPRVDRKVTTLGWTDCGHDDWRPGVVLDPFAGSGTTLAVATGHGRDAIGIDLDERNADLARERIGMFLTVEHFDREGAA